MLKCSEINLIFLKKYFSSLKSFLLMLKSSKIYSNFYQPLKMFFINKQSLIFFSFFFNEQYLCQFIVNMPIYCKLTISEINFAFTVFFFSNHQNNVEKTSRKQIRKGIGLVSGYMRLSIYFFTVFISAWLPYQHPVHYCSSQ